MAGSDGYANLKKLIMLLKMGKPPANIPPEKLFDAISGNVKEFTVQIQIWAIKLFEDENFIKTFLKLFQTRWIKYSMEKVLTREFDGP